MLTPQEVSTHAFTKAVMGGYNMAMVDEFLDELTDDYTNLYKENAALKAKLKVLVEKVEDYRATEDSMRATLLTAQKMADSIVHEAEQKRDQMLSQAALQHLLPGGTFAVDGADVAVPVNLTDHRFFKLHYTKDGEVGYMFSSMYLIDGEGNRKPVGMGGTSGIGMGLKPGTYVVEGETDYAYEPIHGTLVVPADCPESITVEMADGTSGIGHIEATEGGLRVVDGGLTVSCTGRATIDVYDTTGRRVMSCTATDGETIGTTGLPAGVFVARMQQAGAVQSVKFAVR